MNSRFEFFIPSSDGCSRLRGIHWKPEGEAAAVLQICHGMIEHMGRYENFASFMNRNHIAVIGHDHLGHGKTARPGSYGVFAEEDGDVYLRDDLKLISDFAKRQYPGRPFVLLGHSMGSFLVRDFITKSGAEVSGVILLGTGNKPKPVLAVGAALIRVVIRKKGRAYHSEMLERIVLGKYNKMFQNGKTSHEWLSRDGKVNESFEADPLCQFNFSSGAYEDFFQIMLGLFEKERRGTIPAALPLLILSGELDPVGDCGIGVRNVYKNYIKQGMNQVELKLYPKARHELLNELNRQEVYADIVNWFIRKIEI